LQEACELANLTEVPLPVRFIFVLLGPTGSSSLDYHEIGRSISTLMADDVCISFVACRSCVFVIPSRVTCNTKRNSYFVLKTS